MNFCKFFCRATMQMTRPTNRKSNSNCRWFPKIYCSPRFSGWCKSSCAERRSRVPELRRIGRRTAAVAIRIPSACRLPPKKSFDSWSVARGRGLTFLSRAFGRPNANRAGDFVAVSPRQILRHAAPKFKFAAHLVDDNHLASSVFFIRSPRPKLSSWK